MAKRIVVIGDIILDEYIEGTSSRLSPEAPVPVVLHKTTRHSLGGAANVAANIKAMGGEPVLVGVIGTDIKASVVRSLMSAQHINIAGLCYFTGPTTMKTRIISGEQHICRLDYDEPREDCAADLKPTLNALRDIKPDGVVISDYNKGVISYSTQEIIIEALKNFNAPVIIDPKPKNGHSYHDMQGACENLPFLKTPNVNEAIEMTRAHSIEEAFGILQITEKHAIVTAGEQGMFVLERRQAVQVPTEAREVFDVSGAGDTVVAALSLCDWSKDLMKAAVIANLAAGIAVEHHGTYAVSWQELKKRATKKALTFSAGFEKIL